VVIPLAPIFEGTGEPRSLRLEAEGSLFDFLLPENLSAPRSLFRWLLFTLLPGSWSLVADPWSL